MAKTVSLSAHRNTVEHRRKRTLSRELRRGVEKMVRDEDIRAYAIVGIAANGSAFALWDTGAILPLCAFADTVSHLLRDSIRDAGIVDDWRPSLTAKGSTPTDKT